MTERAAKYSSCFGIELQKHLVARSLSLPQLQTMIVRRNGAPLSLAYLQRLVMHQRLPEAADVDIIAGTLGLDPDAAQVLHRAAALDAGFKIGALR